MTVRINVNPEVVRNNLRNLKKLDVPMLLDLLESKTFQGKEVVPNQEFAKLVKHVLSKRKGI